MQTSQTRNRSPPPRKARLVVLRPSAVQRMAFSAPSGRKSGSALTLCGSLQITQLRVSTVSSYFLSFSFSRTFSRSSGLGLAGLGASPSQSAQGLRCPDSQVVCPQRHESCGMRETSFLSRSGCSDSNRESQHPKCCAIARLRYTPGCSHLTTRGQTLHHQLGRVRFPFRSSNLPSLGRPVAPSSIRPRLSQRDKSLSAPRTGS